MDYAKFEIAVVELADRGTPITAVNVAARLRLEKEEAERHISRMAKDGRLELDLDGDEIVYRVRGLSPRVEVEEEPRAEGSGAIGALRNAAVGSLLNENLGTSFGIEKGKGRRKISLGVLLGGLLPGIGLAYSAPWPIVAGATLVVVVGFKVLAWVSLVFAVPFLIVAAVLSAVLGGLYTFQFNQTGKRTPLGDDPDLKRRLPSRLKL